MASKNLEFALFATACIFTHNLHHYWPQSVWVFTKIQQVVYYQRCVPIGLATTRLYVVAQS